MFNNQKTGKSIKVKLSFFPQQYKIDAILAQRSVQINTKEQYYTKLRHPILYRGDTRNPDEIFKKGFFRKIEDTIPRQAEITMYGASINCIACSKALVHAVGFADNPLTTQAYLAPKKEEYGWVYMIHAEKGFDLTRNPYCRTAQAVKEVALTSVGPEQIIAAFKIKTTQNGIISYCDARDTTTRARLTKSWQILILDLKINELCFLQYSHPKLYERALADFKEHFNKGYFRIPWAIEPEETDFPLTYSLTELQKKAYQLNLGISIQDAQQIVRYEQVEGLKFGFSLSDILSSWFGRTHVYAAAAGIPVESLRHAPKPEVDALLADYSGGRNISVSSAILFKNNDVVKVTLPSLEAKAPASDTSTTKVNDDLPRKPERRITTSPNSSLTTTGTPTSFFNVKQLEGGILPAQRIPDVQTLLQKLLDHSAFRVILGDDFEGVLVVFEKNRDLKAGAMQLSEAGLDVTIHQDTFYLSGILKNIGHIKIEISISDLISKLSNNVKNWSFIRLSEVD